MVVGTTIRLKAIQSKTIRFKAIQSKTNSSSSCTSQTLVVLVVPLFRKPQLGFTCIYKPGLVWIRERFLVRNCPPVPREVTHHREGLVPTVLAPGPRKRTVLVPHLPTLRLLVPPEAEVRGDEGEGLSTRVECPWL